MPKCRKSATTLVAAMAGILGCGVFADDDDDRYTGPKACSMHARLLYRACSFDKHDDYSVHRADCIYVTSESDQSECLQEARAEKAEKADECREVYQARLDICDLVGEERYVTEFEPGDFVDPNDIGNSVLPNPYWPLTAGHTHVIVSESEDDEGELVKEVVVVTATEEVREVGGLPCRVIRDLAFEESGENGETEYEAAEATQDWYGQIGAAGAARGVGDMGDTVYCGENTYEVEDELIDNTDGSFAHLKERAQAGFLVRAMPVVGEGDRQEMASDEAEDYVVYMSLATGPSEEEGGDDMAYPCDGGCLQTFEVNPHDPGEAEFKYYLPGTGFVLATKLEDDEPTGVREEVTCVKESLEDALEAGEECGISDAEALTEALCTWSPGAEWMPEDLCDD